MSFHPNEVQRRGRLARAAVSLLLFVLLAAFFRTQVIDYHRYTLQSESNRLREVPLPAPRGIIFDRHGLPLAENIPGYSVSILTPGEDSLRAALRRLSNVLPMSDSEVVTIVRRSKRAPARPAVVLADATFEQVSVLEEHRTEFPNLIIQASPKRYYPDSLAVSALVGYTGEVSEGELSSSTTEQGYKPGQEIGRAGLEKQYETQLRGKEGSRFVEVDARGRVVRDAGARPDLPAASGSPLYTHVDLDLQRFVATYFDTLRGGAVALDPVSGEVFALHSSPGFNPNKFIGGVSVDYYNSLRNDPRKPLYNKAIQGQYPPGSTFKLATSVLALEEGVVTLDTHMTTPCNGGYMFGTRYFRCWEKKGHGSLSLADAIAKSCDVYFYQLGLRITLAKLVAGGVSLKMGERTGIDLPDENRPRWPYAMEYFTKTYGPTGWSAAALNLAIGQGENSQTLVNMARFYTALATDGSIATPNVARVAPKRSKIFELTPEQMAGLRAAMANVISSRGTAASAAIQGVEIAGKTGSAQNGPHRTDAWFVGFAPKEDPKIVVAVMIEYGEHGYFAARAASKIIEHFLKRPVAELQRVEGD